MTDIEFLTAEDVCNIQKSTLPGIPSHNIGLIEGAVTRIINEYLYNGTSDLYELAALYLVAIAKAHAFPDANKRTAPNLIPFAARAFNPSLVLSEIKSLFRNNQP